jgi:membrane protease YdiL (CAAX protease family)
MMVCSVIAIVCAVAKGSDETVIPKGASLDFLSVLFIVISISIGIMFLRAGQGSLPRKGYLDPAITPVMAIMLCAAMLLLGGFGGWWGSTRVDEDSMERLAWMYSGAMIAQIPIVIAYAVFRSRFGSRNIVPSSIIAFVVFVPMTFAITAISHMVFVKAGIESPSEIGHVTLLQLSSEPWGKSAWVVVLCATVGAGIIEEVMYRGLILPSLSTIIGGNTVWKAIIITSILFSAMHWGSVQPSALLGLFVFSIGLCWARVKSGGVVAPAVIHIVFNAINIAFVYSTPV